MEEEAIYKPGTPDSVPKTLVYWGNFAVAAVTGLALLRGLAIYVIGKEKWSAEQAQDESEQDLDHYMEDSPPKKAEGYGSVASA